MIGRLQRYAMDYIYDNHVIDVFPPAQPTGRRSRGHRRGTGRALLRGRTGAPRSRRNRFRKTRTRRRTLHLRHHRPARTRSGSARRSRNDQTSRREDPRTSRRSAGTFLTRTCSADFEAVFIAVGLGQYPAARHPRRRPDHRWPRIHRAKQTQSGEPPRGRVRRRDRRRQHGHRLRDHRAPHGRRASHNGLSAYRARNDRIPARVRVREERGRGFRIPHAAHRGAGKRTRMPASRAR